MDPLVIGGFEYLPTRESTRKRIERALAAPTEDVVRFVLGRAAAFVEHEDGPRPAWSYPRIATNLRRRRKVKLDGRGVRNIVRRHDPALYRARLEANKRKTRIHARTKKRVPTHWIFDAYDLIARGATDAQALARYGFHRRPK